ncbi:MAG: hypothetical protein ACLP0A_04125 [Verrucomicrobiia bacterium]
METKDKISLLSTLLAAVIVAAGWFITGWLNRRKDVAQRRLEHRVEALKSFLPVWFAIQRDRSPFQQPGFLQQLEAARANFQLYGRQDEIDLMEAFIRGCEQQNLVEANEQLGRLVPLVRNRIREELAIDA